MSQFILPSRATDANNNALSGAMLYFYLTGTSTLTDVFTDADLSVAHSNPVIADAGGLFEPIYLDPSIVYRAVLKTSGGSTIDEADPYGGTGAEFASLAGLESRTATIEENALSVASVWQRGSTAPIKAANLAGLNSILAQAVTEGKAVLIPSGDWYCDPGAQVLSGLVPIICEGRVFTSTTGAFITMQAVGGAGSVTENFWIEGGTFINTNGTQAQKNSSLIKFTSDGALISYAEFLSVEAYGFYQMFDNSAGSYTTAFGQEGLMNHGLISACVPHYYGALNAKYCIRHRTGSGTGWKYVNARDNMAVGVSPTGTDPVGAEVVGYPAYVRIEGGVGYVVSDILIDGQFGGLKVHALSIDGNNAYQANISISRGSQLDAQAEGALIYDPIPSSQPIISLAIEPANIGGTIDVSPNARVVCSRIHAQGFGHATGGNYVQIGTGSTTQAICSVEMQAAHTCEVSVQASGLVNGVATGGRKKVFSVRHDGTTVTATEQSGLGWKDPSGAGAGFFDFTAVIAGAVVTFNLTMTATSGGNLVTVQYEVKGGAWRVRRLF